MVFNLFCLRTRSAISRIFIFLTPFFLRIFTHAVYDNTSSAFDSDLPLSYSRSFKIRVFLPLLSIKSTGSGTKNPVL